MQLSRRGYLTPLDIAVLTAVMLIGLAKLPQPFTGDQALSAMMAMKLAHGEVMYADLWDLKQPGIFLFYYVGGALFGFNEVGIHAFELVYMLAFSVVLLLALKGHFRNRTVASFTPLLTVGLYYGTAGALHQTQTEAVVGFPLFLALWLVGASVWTTRRRALLLFLSGLAGGVVLLFKLAFFPILAGFWLTALVGTLWYAEEGNAKALIGYCGPILAGALVPLLFMVVYFVRHDISDLVIWTFLEHPARAIASLAPRNYQFENGLGWFVSRFSPLMVLGVFAFLGGFRGRARFLKLNLVLWIVLGFGVILVQLLSWWEYHYLLLLVPLGILAALGLDVLWSHIADHVPRSQLRRAAIAICASLAMLFSPLILSLSSYCTSLVLHDFALSREQRLLFMGNQHAEYRQALEEVAVLPEPRTCRDSTDLYVIGNPLYYYVSGREPTVPLMATWFFPLQELLTEMWAELERERPRYMFVQSGALDKMQDATSVDISSDLRRVSIFIEDNYRLLQTSEVGTWHVLQSSLLGATEVSPTQQSNFALRFCGNGADDVN